MSAENNPLKALGYLLTAVFMFECVGLFAKLLSPDITLYTKVFARSFFALLPLGFMLLWLRDKALLRTPQPKLHLIRGVIGFATLLTNFYAIGHLNLSTVTAIQFTMPFFMMLLAAIWLCEKLTPLRIGAVLVGFAGAMLTIPQNDGTALLANITLLATIAAFASALLGGASGVIIRRLASTDKSITIAFYFTLSATVFGAFLLPFGFVWPNQHDLLLLMGMGVAGGCAQLLLSQAYRFGQVSVIAPYEYSALLWAMSFDALFFAHIPTLAMLAGAGIIIAADLTVAFAGRKRAVAAVPVLKDLSEDHARTDGEGQVGQHGEAKGQQQDNRVGV